MRQLLWFSAVGTVGFVIDTATLYAVTALGMGLYSGRVLSYLVAVTSTWLLNRNFTFKGRGSERRLAEWASFATSQLGGAAVNLGTYGIMVASIPMVSDHPVIGVAAGSIAGLFVNFALARTFVFRAQASDLKSPPQGQASNLPDRQ